MAPVVLKMDVHCLRCARKIRDAVQSMHAVEEVRVSVDTGRVVVYGASLDASLLRRRIQSRTRKHVAVVSDGDGTPEDPPPAGQMLHMGPTSYSYPYAYGYYGAGYGGGGGWPPAPSLLPYDGARHHQYYGGATMMVANDGAPPCCRDDGPSGCCTMQ